MCSQLQIGVVRIQRNAEKIGVCVSIWVSLVRSVRRLRRAYQRAGHCSTTTLDALPRQSLHVRYRGEQSGRHLLVPSISQFGPHRRPRVQRLHNLTSVNNIVLSCECRASSIHRDAWISAAAIDKLLGGPRGRPVDREIQFSPLRDTIERLASDEFSSSNFARGGAVRIFAKESEKILLGLVKFQKIDPRGPLRLGRWIGEYLQKSKFTIIPVSCRPWASYFPDELLREGHSQSRVSELRLVGNFELTWGLQS